MLVLSLALKMLGMELGSVVRSCCFSFVILYLLLRTERGNYATTRKEVRAAFFLAQLDFPVPIQRGSIADLSIEYNIEY